MGTLAPPRRLLSWTATALGTDFGSYRVYRRPSRSPVVPWSRIGEITVPDDYTAATVEAQHIRFLDYEAGWALTGGQWEAGWDYYVTVVNGSTGVESPLGSPTISRVTVTPDSYSWLVSNVAPYLSFPADRLAQLSGADSNNVVVETAPLGRDRALTRTRLELPYRSFAFGWMDIDKTGQDPVRVWRAAQTSGVTMCAHLHSWDRCVGTLHPLDRIEYDLLGHINYGGKITETSGEYAYAVADYNLPAGVVLDGTADYATIADNDLLDPGSSAFSVVVAAAFAGAGSSKYAASKGNIGTAAGWAIRTTGSANVLDFFVHGASTSGACSVADANFFDGYVHVAVGTTSGTAQKLYRDGATTPIATASTTHGAVSNAVAVALGANNAGASGFMAAAPFQSFAYYARELSASETQAAAYYLLGYPGYRMPPGAVCFIDLRDSRCWNGVSTVLADLSDNKRNATTVSSPPTRGIPSATLALIDRF